MENQSPRREFWIDLLKALVLVAAGLLIYAPAFHGSWIWDDARFIPQNPFLNDPARLWKIWFQPQDFIEYYPIEATVQLAQWDLWHEHTLGYHLTNVALHLFSAFILWRIFTRIQLRFAWLGALLFVVHPVMVESVAWIVGLKNTLSLPPLLLAMCVYLDFEEHRRPRTYLLALGLFLLAMLCKTSVMMLPFTILLYAWWKRGRIDARDLCAAAGFLVITILLGAVSVWIGHIHASPIVFVESASWLHRVADVGWIALFYLYKAAVPLHLLPVYPTGIVPVQGWLNAVPLAVLTGAIAIAWSKRATWGRHAFLGLGFYLLNLGPVAAFVVMNYPVMTWSMDHLVYIPLIGLFGLAAAALESIGRPQALAGPIFVRVIAAVVIVLLIVLARAQAALYVNDRVFWAYAVRHNPDAFPAQDNLAILAVQDGHYTVALLHARRAVELAPKSDDARLSLGFALMKLGRISEARDQFIEATKINPANAQAHHNLAMTFAQMELYPDALREVDQAVRLQSGSADPLASRGEIKRSLGDLPGALTDLNQAIALDPAAAPPYLSRGVIEQSQGDATAALADFRHFRELAPKDPNADYAALWIWVIQSEQGHRADADRDLSAALSKGWSAAPTDFVSGHALFLLGTAGVHDYLLKPNRPGTRCEAYYYAGIQSRLAGDKMTAAADFRVAIATGQKDFFEYTLALGELNALGAH